MDAGIPSVVRVDGSGDPPTTQVSPRRGNYLKKDSATKVGVSCVSYPVPKEDNFEADFGLAFSCGGEIDRRAQATITLAASVASRRLQELSRRSLGHVEGRCTERGNRRVTGTATW